MDPLSSFSQRLQTTWPFLLGMFSAGFLIALWDPYPGLIVTVAVGISMGMLILGPYAAVVLYTTRLQNVLGGHLRWPLLILLSVSAVLILDHLLHWPMAQTALALVAGVGGTALGHDATLAVLELGTTNRGVGLDLWMVILFPVIVGLTSLAGYCSLGFGLGVYHLSVALVL